MVSVETDIREKALIAANRIVEFLKYYHEAPTPDSCELAYSRSTLNDIAQSLLGEQEFHVFLNHPEFQEFWIFYSQGKPCLVCFYERSAHSINHQITSDLQVLVNDALKHTEPTSGLTQAIDFSLDVQELTNQKKDIRDAVRLALLRYPDAKVGNSISFSDGSEAILTTEGFIVKEEKSLAHLRTA